MAEAAVGKRIKISKIKQQIMLAVLGASLVFGVSVVFVIYFVKFIVFNSTVIEEKDTAIANYYQAIKNVGICESKDKNGLLSDKELSECDPDSIDVASLSDTLRYNVLIDMADNNNLESVARESQEKCYNQTTGKKIDWSQEYLNAKTDEEKSDKFNMLKMCSSLRVIPDALPAQKNDTALLASMNQIFLLSGFQPESLSPSSSAETSPIQGIEVIPVSVSVENTTLGTTKLLQNMENSIRSFSFQSATITWSGEEQGQAKLKLQGSALAFYTEEVGVAETEKTIYASKEAKKSGGSTSIKTVEETVKDKTGVDV